jgi:SM-20-related protein
MIERSDRGGSARAISRPRRNFMPPHVVLTDFLDERLVAGLLDLALSRESRFRESRLAGGAAGGEYRRSRQLRDLEDLGPILTSQILDRLPTLVTALQVAPIEAPSVGIEMAVHGDGDYFRRHIDTLTARRRAEIGTSHGAEWIMVLSSVYYFHALPRAFTGGALRLHAIGDPETAPYVDIEPTHNTMVFFPSWAPHEVRPVSCPSRRFADSRFSINCWIRRRRDRSVSGAA